MSEQRQHTKFFPANLRRFRKSRKLSQAKLAKMVGIVQSGISEMELGARMPSLEQSLAIAKALRVKASQLFDKP